MSCVCGFYRRIEFVIAESESIHNVIFFGLEFDVEVNSKSRLC